MFFCKISRAKANITRNYISHEMHNLFVINLKKDKYTAYQVNRPSSFYGFSRPIEFD